MFEGFSNRTVDFLWGIRLNNNKPWFEEHKEEYKKELLEPMKALGSEVFEIINDKYGSRGFIHKTSRIYRDARRLHGADGPYKEGMWFSIERPSEEWTSTPVFWFEVKSDNWSYGMGYYMAKAATMAKFRARIDSGTKKFEKLILPLENQTEFAIEGEEYSRKKAAPSEKTEAWYNRKSFSLIHQQSMSDDIFKKELVLRLVSGFEFLMPFYDYFISLDSDPMPEKK